MKSKFLKLGMPIMVFMLAIVFAFATEKSTTENESLLISGYIMQDGFCVPSLKDCNNVSNVPCTDDDFSQQVYRLRLGETVCSQKLFHSELN